MGGKAGIFQGEFSHGGTPGEPSTGVGQSD